MNSGKTTGREVEVTFMFSLWEYVGLWQSVCEWESEYSSMNFLFEQDGGIISAMVWIKYCSKCGDSQLDTIQEDYAELLV